MDLAQNYIGEYYSKEWAMKNILMLNDEEIERINKEIKGETDSGETDNEQEPDNQGDDNER